MNRRNFLTNAFSATALAGTMGTAMAAGPEKKKKLPQEFYEWRAYRFKTGASQALLNGYLEKALVPALNRLGSKPIGVFQELDPKEETSVFVLIPFSSLDVYANIQGKLEKDQEYAKSGQAYLQTAKDEPGFFRIDSWLLQAFAGMPKLELPSYSKEKKNRIFEVRTYESYSEAKAQRKVDMFNEGEIDIMRDVDLGPIFFGQGLIGSNLPHLTYMLSAENRDIHKQHWGVFGKDPRWKKMSGDARYADTVSKITNRFLQPAPYSQI